MQWFVKNTFCLYPGPFEYFMTEGRGWNTCQNIGQTLFWSGILKNLHFHGPECFTHWLLLTNCLRKKDMNIDYTTVSVILHVKIHQMMDIYCTKAWKQIISLDEKNADFCNVIKW